MNAHSEAPKTATSYATGALVLVGCYHILQALCVVVLLATWPAPDEALTNSVLAFSEAIAVSDPWLTYIAGFFFIYWLWSVIRTNRARGRKGRYGPGWSLAAFFIPIASLFMPYIVMQEAYSESDPSRPSEGAGWVGAWWGLYLGSTVGAIIVRVLDRPNIEDDAIWNLNIAVLVVHTLNALGIAVTIVMMRNVIRRLLADQQKDIVDVFA